MSLGRNTYCIFQLAQGSIFVRLPTSLRWGTYLSVMKLLIFCLIIGCLKTGINFGHLWKNFDIFWAHLVPKIFDGSQQTLRSSNSSRTAENHGYQRVCGLIKKLPQFLRFWKPQTLMVTMVTMRVCDRVYSFSWKWWLYTSMKHAPSAVPDQTANSIVTMVTMRVCGLHFMNMCCICPYDFHYIFQRYSRWLENGKK